MRIIKIVVLIWMTVLFEQSGFAAKNQLSPTSKDSAVNNWSGAIENRKFGIGANYIFSAYFEPGIVAKYWFSNNPSLDLGICIPTNLTFCGNIDFVWNFRPSVQSNSNVEFIPYLGLGVAVQSISFTTTTITINGNNSSSTSVTSLGALNFGVRLPVGLEFMIRKINLSIFASITPSLIFSSPMILSIPIDAGIRYYF